MKDYFERERQWWDAKAPNEEVDQADEAINRLLRWREMERRLQGVETVLDVGGATGAFSIPLARRGLQVTHLDVSEAALEIARQKGAGLADLKLVLGNAADLSGFADRSFDMVLGMDGAISFSGAFAEQAIAESCRVTRKVLILTVSHRAWMAPIWTASSIEVAGRITPAAREMFDSGRWNQSQFPDNPALSRGATRDYMGVIKAFLPAEVRSLLERNGMRVLRVGGLGSFANLCGAETVQRALKDEDLLQEFLDLCDRYDREILPDGPGTRQRAGLIAVAEPK
jgi:SAM-dependent methyltransferase